MKTGTQEIDFSSRPSQFIFQWDQLLVGFKQIKATIGGNLPRNQNALSHEFTVFDEEGNSLTLRVNIKQKTTKETVDGKEVEKPVPGEYTYTVSVRNDSKTKKSLSRLKA